MKRMVTILVGAVAVAAFLAAVPAVAIALDLTGTWEGKLTCTGIENDEKDTFNCCGVIQITQSGTTANIREGSLLYFGRVLTLDTNAKKGKVTFVGCPTNNTLPDNSEMVFATATADPVTGKGTLTGSGPYTGDQSEAYTCKWTFKRVDPADPGVPACP